MEHMVNIIVFPLASLICLVVVDKRENSMELEFEYCQAIISGREESVRRHEPHVWNGPWHTNWLRMGVSI